MTAHKFGVVTSSCKLLLPATHRSVQGERSPTSIGFNARVPLGCHIVLRPVTEGVP